MGVQIPDGQGRGPLKSRGNGVADIIDRLTERLAGLHFGPPTDCVYNPLTYARSAHLAYAQRYGQPPKEVMLLGMNPGPWGMVQTGVPFGDSGMVTRWLGIRMAVGQPATVHPKRPVTGFECPRGEVSGQRLWGWAQARFGTPERFFERFWVANYCPLVFMEASGRNRTPDKLPKTEQGPLFAACDEALLESVQWIRPRVVIGIGAFAA
ncbi:MAG: single-stranded DNA-binding protein, partial [Desulfatitalea sp.]|nr:single-stranded DNA-binding protein [Desulfatitalea sp.]